MTLTHFLQSSQRQTRLDDRRTSVVGMPSHEAQIFRPTWQFDEDDDNYDYDWNGDNLNHDYNDNDGYDYNGDNDDYNGSYNGDSDAMDDKDDDAVVDVATKDTRQAYSREYKIAVLDWHHENGSVKNRQDNSRFRVKMFFGESAKR